LLYLHVLSFRIGSSYKPGPKEKKSSQKEIELTQRVKTYETRIAILSAELEISKKKENFLNEELR